MTKAIQYYESNRSAQITPVGCIWGLDGCDVTSSAIEHGAIPLTRANTTSHDKDIQSLYL